ncbi:carotenoid oxygenase family protein [Herbidospora mongoliensis]|uniref:carotenoid oxygenase family protein n=1 Tax=Herbidospora mongoliensis TaxID=688067 RepID=UPI00082E4390|nr:carotenoid oxygenase family protein [Herbidospora mongoliensis]
MAQSYLQGHLAPVPDEIEAFDLPVTGALPPELTGRYFRNGPNPLPGQDPGHWFLGAGMIHGIRLRDGRAEWYRNRWVKTTQLTEGAQLVDETGKIDLSAVPANTSVIRHADRIFALVEAGLPYEMSPELDTIGPADFGGKLTSAMTAHPKEDPVTGELFSFGYGFFAPFLTYHRFSKDGILIESREIPVKGPTMMHDFAITENYVVWLDLPVVFDLDLAFTGQGMPYRWDDHYGARIGYMRKSGGPVTWVDVDPCYVFHVGNAREDEAGNIVLDAVRYSPGSFTGMWGHISSSPIPANDALGSSLHRWTISGTTAKEEQLDDRLIEFPTINDGHTGLPGRYVYAVTSGEIVKYDLTSGAVQDHEVAAPGEAVFVPRGTAEDDGWLVSVVATEKGSDLLVLDAHDLGHVASVHLPRRVPRGFHGHWLAD